MTRTSTKRKVTVATTAVSGGSIDIMTDAATFDHLKEDIARAIPNANLNKFKFVERATKNTFEQPDALIPEGEFILFMTPAKDIPSGASEESLRTYSTKALEAKLKSKNIGKDEKKFVEKLLKERAEKSKGGKPAPKPEVKKAPVKVAPAKKEIVEKKAVVKKVEKLSLEQRVENLEKTVYGQVEAKEAPKPTKPSNADLMDELHSLQR